MPRTLQSVSDPQIFLTFEGAEQRRSVEQILDSQLAPIEHIESTPPHVLVFPGEEGEQREPFISQSSSLSHIPTNDVIFSVHISFMQVFP